MKMYVLILLVVLMACSSPVRFIQTDEFYQPQEKSQNEEILFRRGRIERPHTVIGIIEAQLGKRARRPELDALILEKARDIGADGVMLVEYDVDRDVYIEHHHAVVGHGPWRHHIVGSHPRVEVKKTASAIAVIFD
jgi:hypothetical protein